MADWSVGVAFVTPFNSQIKSRWAQLNGSITPGWVGGRKRYRLLCGNEQLQNAHAQRSFPKPRLPNHSINFVQIFELHLMSLSVGNTNTLYYAMILFSGKMRWEINHTLSPHLMHIGCGWLERRRGFCHAFPQCMRYAHAPLQQQPHLPLKLSSRSPHYSSLLYLFHLLIKLLNSPVSSSVVQFFFD